MNTNNIFSSNGDNAPSQDVMERAVTMFNVMTGHSLKAAEGFNFLALLNMVAQTAPAPAPAAPAPVAPVPKEEVKAQQAEPSVHAAPVKAECTRLHQVEPEVPALILEPLEDVTPNEEPEAEFMPDVEDLAVPNPMALLRRPARFFKSTSHYWEPGYNWRISVSPFDESKADQSYHVHFSERPTQEEFDEHFRRFQSTEDRCRVHIYQSDGFSKSWRITDEYTHHREKESDNAHSLEELTPRHEWRDGERFRICFWDVRINALNYIYYTNRPTSAEVRRLSSVKRVATVQKRGESNF